MFDCSIFISTVAVNHRRRYAITMSNRLPLLSTTKSSRPKRTWLIAADACRYVAPLFGTATNVDVDERYSTSSSSLSSLFFNNCMISIVATMLLSTPSWMLSSMLNAAIGNRVEPISANSAVGWRVATRAGANDVDMSTLSFEIATSPIDSSPDDWWWWWYCSEYRYRTRSKTRDRRLSKRVRPSVHISLDITSAVINDRYTCSYWRCSARSSLRFAKWLIM